MAPAILRAFLAAGLIGNAFGAAVVTSVEPTRIGYGGGAVTIHGDGFSEDVFNQFDPILGNKVWFANEFVSVICSTPINWNFLLENPQDPSTSKIVCDLPPRDGTKGSDWFNLILKVDGEEVVNDKTIQYKNGYTPLIRSIDKRYGKPGDLITLGGRFFTKEYGNANFGDDGTVENRREQSITAVMMGGKSCELTDDLGNLYGATLDSADSDEGKLTCLPSGTFIGPVNGTVFISDKYGKSWVDKDGGAYSVNSQGRLFIYHTLPEVTSISPNAGGDNGGTHITIKGNTFDSFPGRTKVMVGSTPCETISVTDEELVCSAPSVCDAGSGAGARGLLYELWKETEGDVTDSSSLDESAADYNSVMMDGSTVDGPIFNETNGYTARLSGLFVAPYDGDISFYLHSSDAATLFISTDADPANKAMIIENTGATPQGEIGSPQSDPITMVKGEMYYIEAVHVQAASSPEENFLQISLWEHNTIYHKAQTMYAKDEKQALEMMYDRRFETQKVTFSFMDSVDQVTFSHAGMASSWPVSTSSSEGWGEAFTKMLTYTCEYSATSFIMSQDYEDTEVKLPGSGGNMQDNVQAYCGARALEDQTRITHSYDDGVNDIDAVKSPYLCFAAMGTSFLGRVDIRITWEDNSRNKREDWAQIPNVFTPSDDWSHQCVNWAEAVNNPNVTWIAEQIKEGSKIKVRDVIIPKGEVTGHFFLDSVTISQVEVSIARKAPALANDNVMVKEVTVTDGEDADSYDVVINPWTCNTEEDDFSLFGVKDADIEGLDTSGMTPEDAFAATQAYLAENDKVIFTSAAWGAGTVTVERTTRGSRAMTGTFTVTFGDKTIELPPYPTDKTMVPALDALGMIGARPYYWDNRCFNLRIPISFDTSLGGDLPLMTLDATNLVVDNEDGTGTFRIKENTNGGLMIVQPGGDFFRMISSDPIVTVSVNGFMSSCGAADCTFKCDSALTPELSSVADAVVDGGVVLTISGSGFTEDPTDIIVTVGDLDCEVTAVTASEITCSLEAGEAGTYDISVVVKSKGTATQATQLTHTVEMEIFTNTPDAGSMGGGTPITVTGSGFPNNLLGWFGGSVTIDGSECRVTATSFSEFTCTTSAQSGGRRRRRSASDIVITIGDASASGGAFTYDASMTPAVTALSTTTSSPLGGDTLTITGTAFGAAWGYVLIGDNHCSIVTWFPEAITCVMPSNSHGDYPVHVAVTGNGYADVSGIDPISYTFVVTDMTPRKGSTLGGTKVKITGAGFGNCTDVTAAFGDAMTCEIDSCMDTEIVCTTKKNSKTHQVVNSGRHPTYGPGYIWNPIDVVIQPGDMVDWVWNLQVASEETGISVHQVKDAASTEYAGVGFTSEKSANGRLQEVFDTPGTYYFSSQPVFGDSLFMKGSVIVAGAAEDTTAPLMVKMQDIEAAHQFVADTGSVDFGACTLDAPSDCAADPASTDTFEFTMAVCLTPVVTSIEITGGAQNMSANPIEGFNGAELSIMGSGFSTNMCQNNVMIGDSHMCTVTSNTDSSLVCTVDGNGAEPLHSIKAHKIGVSVANNGAALMSVADASTAVFNLVPRIDSVNVNSGSWAGGNVMVMTGSGLVPHGGPQAVMVTFGEGWGAAACTIIDVKFDYISCLVPDYSGNKGPNSETTITVDVKMGYDALPPIIVGETIEYTFTDAMTASADSMSPTTVSSVEEIVIEGTNFGSTVKVFLRDTTIMSRRRRRAAVRPKRAAPEPEEEESDFVKRNPKMKEAWRCPHGTGKCSYEDVAAGAMGSSHGGRSKRSYDDDIVEAYSAENSAMLTNIICMEDSDMCNRRLNMLFNKGVSMRKKREADEEALLEMILLTEGTFEAEVTATTATTVTFTAPSLPAGTYNVIVNVDGAGNAMNNVGTLTSSMSVTSVNPGTGSINGGQNVIAVGGGFCTTAGATSVSVGGEAAEVVAVTPGTVTFVTPAGADGSADVEVTSCGVTKMSEVQYTYSAASSPAVTDISPPDASGETDIVITGSNFGDSPSVMLGSTDCPISASSDTEITCTAPGLAGGDYPVVVYNEDLGLSNNDIIFVSTLAISSISPSSGSFGGGSPLVIAGTGFDSAQGAATVTVCDVECAITSITTSQIDCLTPENADTGATLACDVVVSQASGTATEAGGFTYDRALTPQIASISPDRGGTGGGTLITITGSGFGASGNKVNVDGSICDIATESATEITCYTNSHNGAIKAPVVVDVEDQGYAAYDDKDAAEFYYIDRWSSIWTWGGLGTPLEGEFIVITPGMTILLDVSTPKLKFLLIKGGKLMFDREQPEIELQSEYILIVEGGSLEIGTEEEPYENKAIITMHGNTRCTELPIFGCKVIGVRNGTLDFHGAYIPVTWTHLADTVEPGDTEITLKQPVTWKVDDHIILATTGDRNSMKENEEHYISAISEDGYTITLKDPLKYQHISISQELGGQEIESRGEVAVLTRNVLIRGNYNEAFLEEIPACEEEFNSGAAFGDAMQTCFAGKFGEELGSDEMGSVIIVSPKYKDQGLVAARIQYVEFTNVGQAFRVGRYPIHFHLPGDMSTSYIRGNAIHHSNNRACTLHDVAHMVVERNVAYSIKGLSFFLEDGVEEHNTLQYNLAVFTRMSNSLLNPDINPASFWIVNFNNKFRHNSCAGGTHFCFWLRPANVPDGPSYTRNYCPRKVNVDEFHNNTAHSMGWYGFWIFGQSNHATYDPHDGDVEHGYCNGKRVQARIGSFTTWNNKRGFEIVSGANIRLENQTHMDHDFAAYEIFTAKGEYGEAGPGIYNSIIVGHSAISDLVPGRSEHCTPRGANLAPNGYTLKDVKFINFDREGCAAMQQKVATSMAVCDACRVEGLEFINSPNKVFLAEGAHQGMWYVDVDGSLTGTAGGNLVGDTGTNPPTCEVDATGELGMGHTGSVCPGDVVFHPMVMYGETSPSSLKYNPVTVKNVNGNASRAWDDMDLGWLALLTQDSINWITYDSSEHVTNISYTLKVGGMHPEGGNYVLIGHEMYQEPDRFTVLQGQPGVNSSEALTEYPTYEDNESGEWFFTNDTEDGINRMVYILSDKAEDMGGGNSWRKKRSAGGTPVGGDGTNAGDYTHWAEFKVFRCFYDGCIPPPPPTLPPGRPLNFLSWSNASDWESFGEKMPVEGDTVFIPPGIWMVMDIDPPPLKRMFLYGGLEISDEADHTLQVEIILVQGGKLECGTQWAPHQHNFDLVLLGDHFTEDMPLPDGPNLGAKALGIFGFLDMHGKDVGLTWTRLAADAAAGDTTIELTEAVEWEAGGEIVISTTSYELLETERRTIASVSGTTITLTEALEFSHLGSETDIDGTTLPMRASVGILSRNVRIVGNNYTELMEQQFGARVLVGEFIQDDVTYTGYARISNVEFYNAGQEGWFDNFDPRYALSFLDTGDSTFGNGSQKTKESYVKKCGFNYGFNSAIGVFASNNIPVEDNVIYRFINNGIFDEGNGNSITGNLVTRGEVIGRIKMQAANHDFYGCIDIRRSQNVVLQNNVMAGCGQAGLITIGSPCDANYTWINNEMHSSQHGLHQNSLLVPRPDSKCVKLEDFYVWKNFDYGVFAKSESSSYYSNIRSVDNGVGFLPYMYEPASDKHIIEEKEFGIKESLFVAVSELYDCDAEDPPDVFMGPAEKSKRATWRWKKMYTESTNYNHHVGVVWPIFQSSYGKVSMPWYKALKGAAGTYPALRGILHLEDTTFANFGSACNGKVDKVFRTNYGEDDVNFPIKASGIKFVNTPNENKLYIDLPLTEKLSPGDCTDFDCDGLKKTMIFDTDGSVSGDAGTIIPDSAYEWDGDPKRGLGYYRVPKPMITTLEGNKIEYEDKMPNTGIIRNDDCVWEPEWRAYRCQNLNHRLMIFESMDRDSKIRRLSPIAYLANPGSEGYVDLVNGFQDHSCCSGYICAERLSTSFAMVATGQMYEMMLSSIPPQNFRFHMLHNEGGDAVLIKMWFPKQQRLDIYVDGMFIVPNNLDFSKEEYSLLPPDDSFIPALTETNGANYFDPWTGHLYVIVKGPATVDVKTQPVVVLKMGVTVPIENFFEENVVGNLAGLLGIDPANIRVTNIVREGSVPGKKRSADGDIVTGVEIMIAPPPSDTLDPGAFFPEEFTYVTEANPEETLNPLYTTTPGPQNVTDPWVPPPGYIDYDALLEIQATITNVFQSGNFSDAIGMDVGGITVEQPIPPPNPPPPYTSPEERNQITELTWAEQSALNNTAMLEEFDVEPLQVPEGLYVSIQPEDVAEMVPMDPALTVYAVDSNGTWIPDIGTPQDPWNLTVSILTGAGGLVGETTVSFVDGLAVFEDLTIDMMGDGYSLQFEITYPTGLTIPPVASDVFDVKGRPLAMKITEEPLFVHGTEGTFSVSASLWDTTTDAIATSDAGIDGYSWECILDLTGGAGNGDLTWTSQSIPMGGDSVTFTDLTIEPIGQGYVLEVFCSSSEAEQTASAKTSPFFVHDWPETGLLRKTSTSFKFQGLASAVQDVMNSFDESMGTMTCSGCPGSGTKRRKRSAKYDWRASPLSYDNNDRLIKRW